MTRKTPKAINEWLAGSVDQSPEGDQIFTAGIDHRVKVGDDEEQVWGSQVEVHCRTKPGAEALRELVIKALNEHSFVSAFRAELHDPTAVFVNMKRGVIGTPSARNLASLFGPVINDEDALQLELAQLRDRVKQLESLLSTPSTNDWFKSVRLEAGHQNFTRDSKHDAGKTPADWFWLIGYLAQKAMTAHQEGEVNKARHHTISTAAVLLNWFRAINGEQSGMVPGLSEETLARLVLK